MSPCPFRGNLVCIDSYHRPLREADIRLTSRASRSPTDIVGAVLGNERAPCPLPPRPLVCSPRSRYVWNRVIVLYPPLMFVQRSATCVVRCGGPPLPPPRLQAACARRPPEIKDADRACLAEISKHRPASARSPASVVELSPMPST